MGTSEVAMWLRNGQHAYSRPQTTMTVSDGLKRGFPETFAENLGTRQFPSTGVAKLVKYWGHYMASGCLRMTPTERKAKLRGGLKQIPDTVTWAPGTSYT